MSFVVVRTYSAGVHVGDLKSHNDKAVVLTDAQRIWYWKGANTLHEIALRGVGAGSKVSERVPEIALTEAIEIINASDEARDNLRGTKWAK